MTKMSPERRREVALACCLVVAAAFSLRLDRSSRVASEVRAGSPVMGFALLRFKGQDRVVPPALYLAVYAPRARSLDLVVIPPSMPVADGQGPRTLADVYGASKDPRQGGLDMAAAALSRLERTPPWPSGRGLDFSLSLELEARARPAYPRETKRRLVSWLADPLFWFRWTKPPLGAYDTLVLARELRRLGPADIRLSSLQDPALTEAWLGRVFGRDAGLPEDAGPATVEVLNASGAPGVALRATKLLRLHGFDVVHFGNAPATEAGLSITDRAGRPGSARAVAALLGCPDLDILTAMEERPRAAMLLELGHDYERCSGLRGRPGG